MLDKTFHPNEVEARLYVKWEKSGAFKAGKRAGATSFSMVIPPPNVTGNLHIGHALNNTLQDALARFERMRGKNVLWQPGTDRPGPGILRIGARVYPGRLRSSPACRHRYARRHPDSPHEMMP